MKKEGYADSTLKAYDSRLRGLARHVNLDNPDDVKAYIAYRDTWTNAFREGVVRAYNHYVRYNGLSWKKPKYRYSKKLPYIATTDQISKIISNCRKKYALILSILRDTGLRPIELHRLTLRDIDLEKGIVTVASTKDGNPRCLRLKPSTLAMLKGDIVEYDECQKIYTKVGYDPRGTGGFFAGDQSSLIWVSDDEVALSKWAVQEVEKYKEWLEKELK